MDRSSLILVALSSRDLSDDIAPLSSKDLRTLIQSGEDQGSALGAMLEDDNDSWCSPLTPERQESVAARLELMDSAEALVSDLGERGIWITTPFEETWPVRLNARLGPQAPALLYGAGEASIFATDGIGIVGSRDLTDEGADVAGQLAKVAVSAGMPVVSGGARGADQVAMSAAMESGGRAVGVLAHPLVRTMRESGAAAAIEDGQLCFVTTYKPDAGFSVGTAMGRNKLIYGFSRATAVVATDDGRGGTWSGAKEALDRGYGSVAVWSGKGEGPGNSKLAATAGAVTITNPTELVDVAPAEKRQPSLL